MSIRSKSIAGTIVVLMAVSSAALAAGPSNKPSVKWNCDGTKKECTCKGGQDCADMIKDAPCTGPAISDPGGKFHCEYKPQSKKN